MIRAFLKVPLAIADIREPYRQSHNAHKDGVEYQPVDWRNRYQESYGQLAHGFQNAYVRKGRHLLMGDDCCVVRHANQTDSECDQ